MNQIVLATNNRHKVQELVALFADIPVRLVSLDDFAGIPPVDEDRPTLEGNALKKAREIHSATHLPTLADDSGLEVYYLNDEPGVLSARYAGPGASYADNCRKLLSCMRGVPPRRRSARFRCVLAFISSGTERTVEGILPGVITEFARGTNGFGYDPIFLPQGHSQTLAEMPSNLKNRLSHRAQAALLMKVHLTDYLKKHGR